MGVPDHARSFASFCCMECDFTFEGAVPAIFIDLPACPECEAATQIHRIMDYTWEVQERWES